MASKNIRFSASLLIATLVVSTAAAPAVAQEASLFGLFRAVCSAGSDPDAGAARARAQGFMPAKKNPRMGDLDETRAFEKTVGGREFFVLVGRGKGKPKDGMPASATTACGVGVKGKDEAGLAAGRRWVGVPAAKSLLGFALHSYRQAGGGHTALSLDDKPALKAALLAGDLNVLSVINFGGSSVLLLSRTQAAG